jgi:hypothetical protein
VGNQTAKKRRPPLWDLVPKKGLGGYYESQGIPTWLKYPRIVQGAQEAVITVF